MGAGEKKQECKLKLRLSIKLFGGKAIYLELVFLLSRASYRCFYSVSVFTLGAFFWHPATLEPNLGKAAVCYFAYVVNHTTE